MSSKTMLPVKINMKIPQTSMAKRKTKNAALDDLHSLSQEHVHSSKRIKTAQLVQNTKVHPKTAQTGPNTKGFSKPTHAVRNTKAHPKKTQTQNPKEKPVFQKCKDCFAAIKIDRVHESPKICIWDIFSRFQKVSQRKLLTRSSSRLSLDNSDASLTNASPMDIANELINRASHKIEITSEKKESSSDAETKEKFQKRQSTLFDFEDEVLNIPFPRPHNSFVRKRLSFDGTDHMLSRTNKNIRKSLNNMESVVNSSFTALLGTTDEYFSNINSEDVSTIHPVVMASSNFSSQSTIKTLTTNNVEKIELNTETKLVTSN